MGRRAADAGLRLDGARLLDDVETFLRRFVAYPSEAARVAHVLWIAHTWFMDEWDSTPRIAFLSPEPGSGKSRALEVTEPLVPRPVHAVNTTPAYLFRKVSDDGRAADDPLRRDRHRVRAEGQGQRGHPRHAQRRATARAPWPAGASIRGKTVETEELPAYCAVALAGLDDLPDTIMTRSVVVRMRRRAPDERVEPWRLRINGPEADELRRAAARAGPTIARTASPGPTCPTGIEDRNADVWEALLAVADLAAGTGPSGRVVAAVTLVTDSSDRGGSLGVHAAARPPRRLRRRRAAAHRDHPRRAARARRVPVG